MSSRAVCRIRRAVASLCNFLRWAYSMRFSPFLPIDNGWDMPYNSF